MNKLDADHPVVGSGFSLREPRNDGALNIDKRAGRADSRGRSEGGRASG